MSFVRAVRRSLILLGHDGNGRWALLVMLAIAVTGFEAAGAILIYTLMSLVSGDVSEVNVPVLGRLTDLAPGMSAEGLQLATAGAVAVFFTIRAGVVTGQAYVQARVVHNAGARLSNHLVRGYLAMPYLSHTLINSSELVRNAFDSVQNLVIQVLKPAVEVVAEVVLVIGLTALLLVVAPQATLIALACLGPMIWILQAIIQPRLKRLGRVSQDARRDALQAMQQALGGLRDIRLLGREAEFTSAFAGRRKVMARSDYLKTSLSELPRTLIESGLVIVIAIIFTVATLSGESRDEIVATLGVFAYTGLRLQPSLRKIVQGLNHVRFGTAIIDDLFADRQRVDHALVSRDLRSDPPNGWKRLETGIELRGVSFAYGAEAAPALRDVDLSIGRGEFVGICGPTGGGKSTLVDLIAGLLEPTEGTVTVDGHPLGAHPSWWYAQLGVVSQSVFLTDDTIRRNIAFGERESVIDEARLQRSVERAQLNPVIRQLPAAMNTMVGERGIRLSGGQRQRVAVARALYREPSVIIFDEGTSALDSATEAALVGAINELKAGRTLISVAHRISTVRGADRIILVVDGRVTAIGTFEELQRENRLFQSLAR